MFVQGLPSTRKVFLQKFRKFLQENMSTTMTVSYLTQPSKHGEGGTGPKIVASIGKEGLESKLQLAMGGRDWTLNCSQHGEQVTEAQTITSIERKGLSSKLQLARRGRDWRPYCIKKVFFFSNHMQSRIKQLTKLFS